MSKILIKLQAFSWLRWWFGDKQNPRPALFYRTDNWITDEKEVERIMRERGLEL